jgi:hypothetical protein
MMAPASVWLKSIPSTKFLSGLTVANNRHRFVHGDRDVLKFGGTKRWALVMEITAKETSAL